MLAAPLLLVGTDRSALLVGIFQAATQINEMTLSFIPKLLGIAATLVLAGPWMLKQFVGYTRMLIESIPSADRLATRRMPTTDLAADRELDRQCLLAVPAHWRLPDGGASVRRELRAAARAHRAGRRADTHRTAAAAGGRRPDGAVRRRRHHHRRSRSSSALALGFALQLMFDALTLGGQLIANGMGLGFAFNIDPLRGVDDAGARAALRAAGHADIPLARRPHRADRDAGRRAFRACRSGRSGLPPQATAIAGRLGRPAVPGRAARRAAGHDRAAGDQPRLRRHQPRGAGAEPVRGGLAGHAGVRAAWSCCSGCPSMQSGHCSIC